MILSVSVSLALTIGVGGTVIDQSGYIDFLYAVESGVVLEELGTGFFARLSGRFFVKLRKRRVLRAGRPTGIQE